MEQLEAADESVGAAGGANGLALGVGGGADDARAEGFGGGGGVGGEHEEGVGEMAQVAIQDGVQDLEGLRELPSADVVAGAFERAGEGVGAGGEDVQMQILEGVGAQAAHVIAGVVHERLAENQAAAGGEGARGAGEQGAAGFGGQFVEDVVDENDVEFFGVGGEIGEGIGIGAEGGAGPADAAEFGKQIVEAAQGGPGMVADGKGDGTGAEVVEEGPGGGAGARAEVEDAQGLRSFGEGGQFGEDERKAGVGLGGEEERVGGAGTGVAQVRGGGGAGGGRGFGGAGGGEAVGEADDVRPHPVEHVADRGGAGFGLGDLQPVGFEFDGIGGGHGDNN